MKPMEYSQVFLQRYTVPCFLAEVHSKEIVFMNEKMVSLLGEEKIWLGKKFYDVMEDELAAQAGVPTWGQPGFHWSEDSIYRNSIFVKKLDKKFDNTVFLLDLAGQTYLFCEYVPYDKHQGEHYNLELALSDSLGIIQNGVDVIPSFLKLLADFYQSQQAFLCRVDEESSSIHLSHTWHSENELGIPLDDLDDASLEKVFQWLGNSNEVGVVEVAKQQPAITHLGSEVLQIFSLENLVLHTMVDDSGKIVAALGLGNRKDIATEYYFLQAVAEFIRQEISKEDISASFENIMNHDILTGFYRRSYYNMVVETLQLSPPRSLGVVFANVNGLKAINSEYGYAKGDSCIKKVAEILHNHFQTSFFRISGDEFVSFFPDISQEAMDESVLALREKLKAEKATCFALGHAWGENNYDLSDLVEAADHVMFINKQDYYQSSEITLESISDHVLSDLLFYLKQGEFMIYLQPQVNLEDASLHGAEALIRRYDKVEKKMVFPDQFIPLYEKKSIIRHIDIFVVEEVCKLLQRWQNEQRKLIPISVNLSRITLQEYGIVDTIVNICEKYQVPHEFLSIEVTERVGLLENTLGNTLINRFIEEGFRISLDDFGCAYSNIVTLAQIHVDEVKLDKSLVDDITNHKKNRVLVDSVIHMCQNLGDIPTLAEGIEDENQVEALKELKCNLGQGYLYSRPISVEEFCEKFM